MVFLKSVTNVYVLAYSPLTEINVYKLVQNTNLINRVDASASMVSHIQMHLQMHAFATRLLPLMELSVVINVRATKRS